MPGLYTGRDIMAFFQTIKAKILALLVLAILIAGLNASVTGYTNRLKNLNNDMSRQTSAIQITVLENLMLEAQYISVRDPELLKKIIDVDNRFKGVLQTMQTLSDNEKAHEFIQKLSTTNGKHQDIFKQISSSLIAFDSSRKELASVNSVINDDMVGIIKDIESKSLSFIMQGDPLPDWFNTMISLLKDMIISLNINDRNIQNLLVSGQREEYVQKHEELRKQVELNDTNIQIAIKSGGKDYKDRWQEIKSKLTHSQELEDAIVSHWDNNRKLEQELSKAVSEVRDLAKSLNQLTEAEILRYEKIGSRLTLTFLAVGLLAFIIIGGLIANSIVKPINHVVHGLRDAAEGEGDLTKRIDIRTKGEVGELARWFNVFVEKIQQVIAELAKNAGELSASSVTLADISTEMAKGAEETSSKAKTVANNAEEMSSNIRSVSAATEETATNMSTVASAAEEMTATINEISRNTENARRITDEAVSQTARATKQITDLGNAAQQIERVIETITEISEQVSLLALNATIESARAGEAGKGFAVVAHEIKELAKQTADASGQIRQNIEAIQSSTTDSIKEINAISKVVDDVNQIVSTISAAIEEQSITTRDISENVAQAAKGINEVNTNVAQASTAVNDISNEISMVTAASGRMSSSSTQVNSNSMELSKLARQLNTIVTRFKI
jgi:methyl-accepting chemotaxis protein